MGKRGDFIVLSFSLAHFIFASERFVKNTSYKKFKLRDAQAIFLLYLKIDSFMGLRPEEAKPNRNGCIVVS